MHNPLTAVLSQDQADLIAFMILTVPLSFLLLRLTNKWAFLCFSVSFTILFQSVLFPEEKYFLWGQQLIVFLLIRLVPQKHAGKIIFAESSVVLLLVQLRRMSLSYGQNSFDITGILMMQFFNYVGLATNYSNAVADQNLLSDQQKSRLVTTPPDYFTYLGYTMFLPASLVGPVYEYTDFDAYLHRRGDFKEIPSPAKAVANELGLFVLSVVLYGASSCFGLAYVTEPAFAEDNLAYKLLYIVLCITHIQLKYVSAWSLGMAGMRASGFTYQKVKDSRGELIQDFGRVEVNNITNFYLNPSFKVKADSWNVSVQWGLRRYVYEQIYRSKEHIDEKSRKKQQAKAQSVTLLVSALWHGLYLGYFISFLNWVPCLQISQELYRIRNAKDSKLGKLWLKHATLFNLLQNIVSTFIVTYFGMAIHLMIWTRIKVYLQTTYCLPYVLLYVAYFFVVHLRMFSPKQHIERRAKESLAESNNQPKDTVKKNRRDDMVKNQ